MGIHQNLTLFIIIIHLLNLSTISNWPFFRLKGNNFFETLRSRKYVSIKLMDWLWEICIQTLGIMPGTCSIMLIKLVSLMARRWKALGLIYFYLLWRFRLALLVKVIPTYYATQRESTWLRFWFKLRCTWRGWDWFFKWWRKIEKDFIFRSSFIKFE